MKVLTAAEMREVDRLTIELGIGGPILMENAGCRVVEFIAERFRPVHAQRIVIFCGKGNNGGDGYVIARQLWTRFRPSSLHVISVFKEDDTEPRRMLEACGCPVHEVVDASMRNATLVIDAVLGTGVTGAARGKALDAIREINTGFPLARVVAVDLPSGMTTDSGVSEGEIARADATVTFTAPKLCHVLSPNCDRLGELRVAAIGSPHRLMDNIRIYLSSPEYFRHLLGPRKPESNKGTYGHALVVGGAEGKSGAAEMCGLAALRIGAGLVTVASSVSRLNTPELMTDRLPASWEALAKSAERKNVIAIGPGLGTSTAAVDLVRETIARAEQHTVIDADALNALAGQQWRSQSVRIITPHPGEMSRLAGVSIADVQANRIETARRCAADHNCTVVLKGHRTVIALADGRVWLNPTGSPSMAKGGTGDVLTGITAGLIAQHPDQPELAVIAAVWLHGRSGELAAKRMGEQCVLATELLHYLPEAIGEAQGIPDEL